MTLSTRRPQQQCNCPPPIERLLERLVQHRTERHDHVDRDVLEHPTPGVRGAHPTAKPRARIGKERPHG
jgi:hypothetical protein